MISKPVFALLIPLLLAPISNSFSQACPDFGSGSMGAFRATNDTVIAGGEYHFTTFRIDQGVKVRVSGTKALLIRCKETAIINGILDASGGDAAHAVPGLTTCVAGLGVAGGADGAAGIGGSATTSSGLPGSGTGAGYGGIQGSGGSGAGHAQAGTGSGHPSQLYGHIYGDSKLSILSAGSGGGSGSSVAGHTSGAGGAGGGIIIINADDSIIIGSHGEIRARGGHGSKASNPLSGCGAGGSGGCVWLAGENLLNYGLIDVSGGQGAEIAGSTNPYGKGGHGSEGRIKIEYKNYQAFGTIQPYAGYSDLMFTAGISRVVDITCHGKSDGYMRIRSLGGERPIQIHWSNGARTESIQNLRPGLYQVTVTDGRGCVMKDEAVINEPTALSTLVSAIAPSCPSNSDGQLLMHAQGGTPYPYEKSLTTTFWSNTGSQGVMFEIKPDRKIHLQQIGLTTNSHSVQRIRIWYKQGSFSGYEFDESKWTYLGNYVVQGQGPENETPVILPNPLPMEAMKYSFFIYDMDASLNCVTSSALGSVFVFDPMLTIYEGIGRDAGTQPFSGALMSTRIFSGRLKYQIRQSQGLEYDFKSPFASGNHQHTLPAGEHLIKVRDALGCELTRKVEVPASESFKTEVTGKKNPGCHDSQNGYISLSTQYGENKKNLSTQIPLQSTSGGVYITLHALQQIELSGFDLYTTAGGMVKVFYRQGEYIGYEQDTTAWNYAGEFQLLQNPGIELFSHLSLQPSLPMTPGHWSILLCTNSPTLRCLDTTDAAANSSLQIIASNTLPANATAFASSALQSKGFAGCINYKLSTTQLPCIWNHGAQGRQIYNLGAGNYTAIIGDTTGCFEKVSVNLESPAPMLLTAVMTKETDQLENGSLTVSPSGGTPPYYIQWVASGETGSQLSGLSAGDYAVFIADKNGCRYTDTLTVTRFDTPIRPEGELFLVPNPGEGFTKVFREIKGMDDCILQVMDVRGRLVRNERTSITRLMTEGLDLRLLKDGMYAVTVRDDDQFYTGRITLIH